MTTTIPKSWMPPAPMKRIHVHWTAGNHTANATDRKSYHILVQGDGSLVRGDRSIAANAPNSGMTPASHTKSANTGAIGVSLCCMVGARESPFNAGRAPMTEKQWESALDVVASLARTYEIAVTSVTILTHAEVQPNLNIPQNNKWDITRLAFDDSVKGYKAVGDVMRLQVAARLDDREPPAEDQPMPDEMKLPRFRVHGVDPSTLNVRDAPSGTKIGMLAENRVVERIAIDGHWWKVRISSGHVGWVFSDYLRAA